MDILQLDASLTILLFLGHPCASGRNFATCFNLPSMKSLVSMRHDPLVLLQKWGTFGEIFWRCFCLLVENSFEVSHCFSKLFLPSSHKMGVHLHAGWSIKSAQIFFRLCWPVSVVPRLSKVSRRSWIDPKIRWEDRFSHCIMEIPTWDLLDWTDKIGFVTSLRWIELCSLPGICSGTQNVEIQISLR